MVVITEKDPTHLAHVAPKFFSCKLAKIEPGVG